MSTGKAKKLLVRRNDLSEREKLIVKRNTERVEALVQSERAKECEAFKVLESERTEVDSYEDTSSVDFYFETQSDEELLTDSEFEESEEEGKSLPEEQKKESEDFSKVFSQKMDSKAELDRVLQEWGLSQEDYYVKEWRSTEGVKFQPMLKMLGGMRRKKPKGARKKMVVARRPQFGEKVTRIPVARNIIPDKTVADLVWTERGVMSGAPSVAKRWHTNGAYDVDPALGGGSINGFNTWSAFYSFNRVLSYRVSLTLANQEPTPVAVYFVHMNTDPGTSTTTYPIWATQAFGHSTLLSGQSGGKDRMVYTKNHGIRQIVGDRMPITSDRYVGSSSANPTDLTYFGVSVVDGNGFEMTAGVVYQIRLTLRVEFFDRKNFDDVTSLLSAPPDKPTDEKKGPNPRAQLPRPLREAKT